MSTAVVEELVVASVSDDDVTHLVCCDTNRARCGEDVTAHEWRNNRADPECCPLCVVLRESAWDAGRCCPVAEVTW